MTRGARRGLAGFGHGDGGMLRGVPDLSDDALCETLSTYAGLVAHVLDDPERWLGWGADEPATSLPGRVGVAAARKVLGEIPPGSRRWADLPVEQRADWWTRASPSWAGSSRGRPASSAPWPTASPRRQRSAPPPRGSRCAPSRAEARRRRPGRLGPLLARVLFDRHIPRGHCVDAVRRWSRAQVAVRPRASR